MGLLTGKSWGNKVVWGLPVAGCRGNRTAAKGAWLGMLEGGGVLVPARRLRYRLKAAGGGGPRAP